MLACRKNTKVRVTLVLKQIIEGLKKGKELIDEIRGKMNPVATPKKVKKEKKLSAKEGLEMVARGIKERS